MKQVIREVLEGSIGEELGLEKGDILLAIDGKEIDDVLDYFYYLEGEYIVLTIETKDGETVTCEVEKEEDEDLGLVFEEEFMGKYHHCSNKCVFCFVDQMPPGMRPTLYFKDDDARLSFLSGSYITMTNMSQSDFDKIIRYQMSPINVSIHAVNPDVRVKMLKNPNAANIMDKLTKLKEAGIFMNGQIVLCKGLNDGPELDRSIHELYTLYPNMQSLGIVPVGVSKFRNGLYPLEPFTKEDAKKVIRQVEPYQQYFYKTHGTRFVHLSDEFYIMAEEPLPSAESYDGYLQIENGVGMMRSFIEEANEEMDKLPKRKKVKGKVSVVTGVLAGKYIQEIADRLMQIYPDLTVLIYVIENHFFGEHITVSGLLTGRDIMDQLKGKELGSRLLLPGNLVKSDEDVLLDDVTVSELEKALHIPISIVKSSGNHFIETILTAAKTKRE